MPSLVLGPLLRYAAEDAATVWVETDAACTVEVLGHREPTFRVAGHHYALVVVRGLDPGVPTPYEVALDGRRVWPADDDWPASIITTTTRDRPLELVFGSCRVAYPNEPPYTLRKDQDPRGREVDALRSLAQDLARRPPEAWPDGLLLLGDQIYADEVEPATQAFIEGRRDPDVPPGGELAGLHEYTHAYKVSWGEPAIRWLLSTVPSAMIFDDHDVIDDWNTSRSWIERIRAQGWWDERIVGAFASYWIYQHLGNLSPDALETDETYAAVRAAEDGEEILREFAWRADRTVNSTRWSFCRDFGSARLIMVDSRGGRMLDPDRREMVDDDEWAFIEHHATAHQHDHVLLGTSLPWLLAPGMHHLEAWNEAVSEGAWGSLLARQAEKLREALDLEHWAAFGDSWLRLTELVGRVARGEDGTSPPSTVIALSGDVHHAYVAEADYPGARSQVFQAVCSPFRNPLSARERRVIKGVSSRPAAAVTGALARAAGVERPPVRWRLRQPPVFDNVVATLRLEGRAASMRLQRARPDREGRNARLDVAFEGSLAGG